MAGPSSWPARGCAPAAACVTTFSTIFFVENFPGRARIYTINGFSAHADQAELLAWQKQTSAKRTFLVHGEEDTMRQFAAHLADTRVEMPGPNQVFEL